MLYWYNNYGDDMNIKKLVKVAVTVIIIVILGFLIKDNYYLLTNKIEYVYTKYLQGDIRQNLTDNKYRKKENYDYVYFAKVDDQFMNKYGSLFIDKYDDHMIKITDIGDYKGPY